MTYTVAVLLPGITGSLLLDTQNNIIWPDAICSGTSAQALAFLEETDLVAGTPTGWGTATGYGSFAAYFQQKGFEIAFASSSNPIPPASLKSNLLIGFGYDWRQDNTTSAQALQTLLNNIDHAYGDYQLFLIAHSMGGLVSRAYLETSLANPKIVQKIKGLITLGTPHLGAPVAMSGIMDKLPDALFVAGNCAALKTVIPEFVNKSWSDSTYELLPPDLTSAYPKTAFLFASTQGPQYSIFDPKLPDNERQAITNLSTSDMGKASTFFNSLNYSPTESNGLPPYYCLGGDGLWTCENLYFSQGEWNELDLLLGGDGVVPIWSSVFDGRPVSVTAKKVPLVGHGDLPSNQSVQDQVAQWMGI